MKPHEFRSEAKSDNTNEVHFLVLAGSLKVADGDMEVVNSWYGEFGGNDIGKIQESIRKSVEKFQFETVSFIVFAHEYAANPSDKKFFSFIYLYYHEDGVFQLNLSSETRDQISKLLNDPDIKGKNLNATPLIPGTIFHAKPVPVTLNADELRVKGGFKLDGAGNYNLAIKALDLASKNMKKFIGGDLMARLNTPGSPPGPSFVKDQMVQAYKVLLPFWGDSDLCKFGFTQR